MSDRYLPQHILRDEIDWTDAAEGKVLAWDDATKRLRFVPSSGAPSAADVSYDPTESGLTATDVQAAIDEVAGMVAGDVPSLAVWHITAAPIAVAAGETVRVGMGQAGGLLIAWTGVDAGVTVSLSEAATLTLVIRNETDDDDVWEYSESLTAGAHSIGASLALGTGAGEVPPATKLYSATVEVSAGAAVVSQIILEYYRS